MVIMLSLKYGKTLLFFSVMLAQTTTGHVANWTLAEWMGQLDQSLLLQDILLPGSHNAGSFRILNDQDIASCGSAGLEGIPQDTLGTLLDWEHQGTVNLVETQRVAIKEQLELGSRFLDLRLGWHGNRKDIYLHHTLFMDVTFQQVLNDTASFLREFDTEVVILKLRLQCGAPLAVATDLLQEHLGGSYGGPLLPTVSASPLSQVQGLAFVIFDESDRETAIQMAQAETFKSVQADEYYRVYPCQEDVIAPTAASKQSGSGAQDPPASPCAFWPNYNPNQGQRFFEDIAADISVAEGTQLANWKPFTTSDSFRVLSVIGTLPVGKGCDPSSATTLGLALMSCSRIGIDSFTETFQDIFLDLLATLEAKELIDAINVIAVDYIDGFPIEAIVQRNKNSSLAYPIGNATHYNETGIGAGSAHR